MDNTTMQLLDRVKEKLDKAQAISYASNIMFWDAATGAPKSGVEARSHSIGTLSGFYYDYLVNSEMAEDLDILSGRLDELDTYDKLIIQKTKKEVDKMTKIPSDEYQAYQVLTSKSSMIWEKAKESSDFKLFEPYLTDVIDTLKRFADYRGYEGHPYNLYIDDYEEGMTVDMLNTFFEELRVRLVPFFHKIQTEGKTVSNAFVSKSYPVEIQKKMSVELLELIGFDLERGLFEESVHPFTSGIDIDDVRLTTHYYENDLASALLSTAHEGGHAIYEQNIDCDLQGTILAEGTSNGIHESQSRIYENNFFKSRAFMAFYFEKLKNLYPDQLKDIDTEVFYKGMNKAAPSLIRIEADELTYSLHIMIRYEIELDLISGKIDVADLPKIWNEKVEAYLGIVPSNDAEGVLQDVHWSEGLLGYFPTYALGNAYAAQIQNTMKKEMPLDEYLAKGNFKPITKWLNEKIHKYGSSKTPNELIEQITGERLNSKYYCDYLEEKYSKIYFD